MNRLELVLSFIAVFALAMGGLWLGWRNRGRRQSELPALAAAPADLGEELAPPIEGLYVGTTVSAQWQNRVVVHTLGQRADARARLGRAGVLIERQGAGSVFIPAAELIDARLEPALAGKVVGAGGLLVLRWQHGTSALDTGIRADEKQQYVAWIAAIDRLTALSGVGGGSEGQGTGADE